MEKNREAIPRPQPRVDEIRDTAARAVNGHALFGWDEGKPFSPEQNLRHLVAVLQVEFDRGRRAVLRAMLIEELDGLGALSERLYMAGRLIEGAKARAGALEAMIRWGPDSAAEARRNRALMNERRILRIVQDYVRDASTPFRPEWEDGELPSLRDDAGAEAGRPARISAIVERMRFQAARLGRVGLPPEHG